MVERSYLLLKNNTFKKLQTNLRTLNLVFVYNFNDLKKKTHLVGTTSFPSTSSHDVILIGQAICPKLSLTNASHEEYGVFTSLCNRSERCKRARRLGDEPDDPGVGVVI